MNGVFLSEGEQVGIVDPTPARDSSTSWKTSAQFDTTEIERKVTSPDSNRKISRGDQEVRRRARGRLRPLPQDADLRRQRPAAHLPRRPARGHLPATSSGGATRSCRRSPGRVDRPLQRIREFRNRPEPGIVVSVDMMTTGVDIPDLEFIVFLRPVKSRILFEQMLGRGTRKGEKYPDKSHFTVFDCFDGTLLEYFRKATGITASRPRSHTKTHRAGDRRHLGEPRPRLQRQRAWSSGSSASTRRCPARPATCSRRSCRTATWPPYAAALRAVSERLRRDHDLLRDPNSEILLVNYPRPQRLPAPADAGRGLLGWLIHARDGKEHKPEDYLKRSPTSSAKTPARSTPSASSSPPRNGAGRADRTARGARPSQTCASPWTTPKGAPGHYRKALVDVISMVKHAAETSNRS